MFQSQVTAQAYCPDIITKELAISRLADTRKIRLSSNLLPLVGFEKDTRFTCEPMGHLEGLRLTFDPSGTHKVHQRRYAKRKNNPFETQIDLNGQALINQSIPNYTERLHFQMRAGEILITPLVNRTFSIRRSLADCDDPFTSFVGMTSGVDALCLQRIGFTIDSVLEFRPQEARDNTDLTETGISSILANVAPRIVLNQNVFNVDWRKVEELVDLPAIGLLHMSPQCDDYSSLKNMEARQKSVESLDTTRDMFMDCLRAFESLRPATGIIENVPSFGTSTEGELMKIRLRRMGYFVTDGVFDSREFGGLTSRKRYYMVASIWPGFAMPTPAAVSEASIWPVIEKHLDDCRDVSHTSSVAKGIETGRIRTISKDSSSSPTFTKSQSRQAKDSVYIEHEGRYLLPSEFLMKELMSIPQSFNLDAVSSTIASEQIGQSICFSLHHAIAKAVHQHIADNVGHCTVSTIKNRAVKPQHGHKITNAGQMSLAYVC